MDSDNGLCKSSLQRYRDRGNDYEDAEELSEELLSDASNGSPWHTTAPPILLTVLIL